MILPIIVSLFSASAAVHEPLFEAVRSLPVEMQDIVLSMLPTEYRYMLMINHRSSDTFLNRIKAYALFESRETAIELFWRCNQAQITATLEPESIQGLIPIQL